MILNNTTNKLVMKSISSRSLVSPNILFSSKLMMGISMKTDTEHTTVISLKLIPGKVKNSWGNR
ncbi:hypothetical protein F030043B2_21920 [Bacteroides fragilis]